MFSDEQRVVKNVVNRVMKEMKKVPLEVAKHPVGLDEAVQEFNRIAVQSAGPMQIVGIWGMGGSGKTTLAKELHNKKCSTVNRSSFLFDLRQAARKELLYEKQKRLLEDLELKVKGASFDNVDKGKKILKSRLRSVFALIILDDVDHTDQLDALLPTKECLGHGSLVIVTTREKRVLKAWGITTIYKMRALNETHAQQLFCWHAFLQPSPLMGFEDLVERFRNACHGLPLSLKVLGGQLYGESSKDYWQAELEKLSRILPDDIKSRLKISYDALDKEEKEMFLDIACFFIGWRSSWAIAVWDGSQWNGLHGWERLMNKCLVELDEENCIRMHDHLRDLGREIANQKSPYRLWFRGQIIEFQPQQEGIRIRGIANAAGESCYSSQGKIILNTSQGPRDIKPCSIGLKILVGTGHFFNQQNDALLKELVWLRCYKFQHSVIPSWFAMKNLRVLQFFDSERLEDLWNAEADAKSWLQIPLELRELTIKNCRVFGGFPESIGQLTHLKEIRVIGKSSKMRSLPREFCLLQSLELLKLYRCENLSSLPSDFGKLTRLERLDLSYCPQLKMIPDSTRQLTLLQYLNLEGCWELTFKSENIDILEHMTKLEYLNVTGCWKLEELPLPNGVSLRELYIKGTRLRELPSTIGQLSKLAMLEISSELLKTLPTCVGNLSSLLELKISSCPNLESLPSSLWNLSSLTKLEIASCEKLHSLPDSLGRLNLSGQACRIKNLQITSTKLSKISIPEELCPCLVTLTLRYNRLLREVETLPKTLETVKIDHCDVLENITAILVCERLSLEDLTANREINRQIKVVECGSISSDSMRGAQFIRGGGIHFASHLCVCSSSTSLEDIRDHYASPMNVTDCMVEPWSCHMIQNYNIQAWSLG
ncbi:hypothetical protein SUGI_0998050 [Cryptomeria japonica]|nr:hypothetical protein SUGI_0998050 [Cryptomeria japonica]